MRNKDSISILERDIPDYRSNMIKLGFNNWKDSFSTGQSISSKNLYNPIHALEFLNFKINQQNTQYQEKNNDARQASGGYYNAQPTNSNLYGFKSNNNITQINNLLDQAIHNQGKGSFNSRNASALDMAISKLGKAFSSTSMSSGGNHPQQKNPSLQKSQSLPTSQQFQSTQQLQSDKKGPPRNNHKDLKKPNPREQIKKQKKTSNIKKIRNFLAKLTSNKTQKQNIGPSSRSPQSKEVNSKPNLKSSSLSRNSSFASSRSGSISHQSSINRSQSFSDGLRPQQNIAGRNQSISRSNIARPPQNSFSSQNSRSSGGSHASRVSQSRSDGRNGSGPRR